MTLAGCEALGQVDIRTNRSQVAIGNSCNLDQSRDPFTLKSDHHNCLGVFAPGDPRPKR